MNNATKKQKLLALLKREWTSPLDALDKCGLLSLSQRVSNWRAEGMDIKDRWVTSPSGSRFKEYKAVRTKA